MYQRMLLGSLLLVPLLLSFLVLSAIQSYL